MKLLHASALAALLPPATAFLPPAPLGFPSPTAPRSAATLTEDAADDAVTESRDLERRRLKLALLGRLGGPPPSSDEGAAAAGASFDPVLADPLTKEPLRASLRGPILGGGASRSGRSVALRASPDSDRVFAGRTDTYINLLEPASDGDDGERATAASSPILSSLLSVAPPPLRSLVADATNSDVEYVPMRDLFTSPQVSFAYERGWRQGFAAAGFPGADKEFDMARDYFAPVVERKRGSGEDGVLVDMSCATGLFTRRFAKCDDYPRVIACDYSDSMLAEARRRIRADPAIDASSGRLDLVRCDVGCIPMRTESVDAFHAGAAMHCWPEIERSLREIYRVLAPGGRYFATTFSGNYFSNLSGAERMANGGEDLDTTSQAFQYFPSADYLRDLLLDAGFEEEKTTVETIGSACVIIRCEK